MQAGSMQAGSMQASHAGDLGALCMDVLHNLIK
jgi:hypothetical protein